MGSFVLGSNRYKNVDNLTSEAALKGLEFKLILILLMRILLQKLRSIFGKDTNEQNNESRVKNETRRFT